MSVEALSCPAGLTSAAGSATCTIACPNCLTAGACAEGYTGGLCSVCAPNYYASSAGSSVCLACEPISWPFVLFVLLLLLLCVVVYLVASPSDAKIRSWAIRVLPNLVAIVVIISGISVEWPQIIQDIASTLQWMNFSVDAFHPECQKITWSLYTKIVGSFAVPAMFILLLFVWMKMKQVLLTEIEFHRDNGTIMPPSCMEQFKNKLSSVCFNRSSPPTEVSFSTAVSEAETTISTCRYGMYLILNFSYSWQVSLALNMFRCVETPSSTNVISYDNTLECDGVLYFAFVAVAIVTLLVVGLGLPSAIFWKLNSLTKTNSLSDIKTLNDFGFMYFIYPSQRPYFDAILLVRKLALLAVQVATLDGLSQAVSTLVVSALYLAYIMWRAPFEKMNLSVCDHEFEYCNLMERVAASAIIVGSLAAIIIDVVPQSTAVNVSVNAFLLLNALVVMAVLLPTIARMWIALKKQQQNDLRVDEALNQHLRVIAPPPDDEDEHLDEHQEDEQRDGGVEGLYLPGSTGGDICEPQQKKGTNKQSSTGGMKKTLTVRTTSTASSTPAVIGSLCQLLSSTVEREQVTRLTLAVLLHKNEFQTRAMHSDVRRRDYGTASQILPPMRDAATKCENKLNAILRAVTRGEEVAAAQQALAWFTREIREFLYDEFGTKDWRARRETVEARWKQAIKVHTTSFAELPSITLLSFPEVYHRAQTHYSLFLPSLRSMLNDVSVPGDECLELCVHIQLQIHAYINDFQRAHASFSDSSPSSQSPSSPSSTHLKLKASMVARLSEFEHSLVKGVEKAMHICMHERDPSRRKVQYQALITATLTPTLHALWTIIFHIIQYEAAEHLLLLQESDKPVSSGSNAMMTTDKPVTESEHGDVQATSLSTEVHTRLCTTLPYLAAISTTEAPHGGGKDKYHSTSSGNCEGRNQRRSSSRSSDVSPVNRSNPLEGLENMEQQFIRHRLAFASTGKAVRIGTAKQSSESGAFETWMSFNCATLGTLRRRELQCVKEGNVAHAIILVEATNKLKELVYGSYALKEQREALDKVAFNP